MIAGDQEKKYRAAEVYADATWESYRIVVGRAFAARESNSRLARDFFEKTVEEIQEQARLNRCATQKLAVHTREQSEALGELAEGYTDTYGKFLDALPKGPRE